jgi:hypothetical protein
VVAVIPAQIIKGDILSRIISSHFFAPRFRRYLPKVAKLGYELGS